MVHVWGSSALKEGKKWGNTGSPQLQTLSPEPYTLNPWFGFRVLGSLASEDLIRKTWPKRKVPQPAVAPMQSSWLRCLTDS